MIRLIHTSDLHLDSEFSCNDPKLTSLRKKEQRALFANLMMYVRDQKADVLLISGDLFDKKQPEKETAEVVLREFRNTPETEIFIAAGRSDCCRPGSFLYETEFPPNVHVFREEALSSFSVDRLHLTVYGYSFCHRNLTKNPFAVMPPVDKSRFNSALRHRKSFFGSRLLSHHRRGACPQRGGLCGTGRQSRSRRTVPDPRNLLCVFGKPRGVGF